MALVIIEGAFGPDDPQVANFVEKLALACEAQGNYAEAERLYRRAHDLQEKTRRPYYP